MNDSIQSGLLVLHGNRAEWLGDAVFEWIARHPLQPLEEEVFLVQSNGVAEWLKMSLAAKRGVCAAARVELPGRFLWRAYRQVLGRDAVPAQSVLDKLSMTWRLMALLPVVVECAGYEPLARFLADGDVVRRLQLAERLADLFDQYQVYRSDWLAAWEAGRDVLPQGDGAKPLDADQAWQARLWRELLGTLDETEREAIRSRLHARFVAALQGDQPPAEPVARRVVLFGMTHVPMQTLEALAALATRAQVVLAIPNPSQYHWADIIEGRELLRMARRRQPLKHGVDLTAAPLQDMHAHGHPLLAAWGRQSRDFVRQLDQFDDAEATRQRFSGTRIDLFSDGPGDTLLQQVHAAIRDLEPQTAERRPAVPASDRSIVFHVAHSAQREVEVLHDQLLALLADPAPEGEAALQPRDIVVMVPDIANFAPAIRSVFGQYRRHDARFIPFDIADLQERGNNPMLVALEWLLRLPQQRCRASEVRDLLDVPAVARRFDLDAADLPRLAQWMEGAGIRWGLDAAQRDDLGLGTCGEQNTWLFGLRRMLLGFAAGPAAPAFDGIEPYAEVGGLDAALAGALADLLDALVDWWQQARTEATPAVWGERMRALLVRLFAPTHERERLTLAAAHDALRDWLDACDTAGFDRPVPLAVLREAWLAGVDAPSLNKRFRAGGVTFCTLLPMRAIPFEVVCLLGMNDGDYPRRTQRSDFDLMGLPGQRRPGDRSRRDDDRQLMLEAVLSARRVLYVSWVGRSVRNNSEQPPSVLVSQLRDYLNAGWQGDVLEARTTEHPLQPFSRRYFEVSQELFTYAREWRAVHEAAEPVPVRASAPVSTGREDEPPLTVATLAAFLKNPVRHFFRQRLAVAFADEEEASPDDEVFALDGLQDHGLLKDVVAEVQAAWQDAVPGDAEALQQQVAASLARVRRAGALPMAAIGRRTEAQLIAEAVPMLAAWQSVQAAHPEPADKAPLRFEHAGAVIDDWLDGLRQPGDMSGDLVGMLLIPSRLCAKDKARAPRPDKLIDAWVRALVASACGVAVRGLLVGRDALLTLEPMDPATAREHLEALIDAYQIGMRRPLPVACRTAFDLLADKEPEATYEGGPFLNGEVEEPSLARVYPDFEALTASGEFEAWAQQLYEPVFRWVKERVQRDLHSEHASHDEAPTA